MVTLKQAATIVGRLGGRPLKYPRRHTLKQHGGGFLGYTDSFNNFYTDSTGNIYTP